MLLLQAVERLNIKPGHWKDLLTDEPWTRKDIITIQVSFLACTTYLLSIYFTSNIGFIEYVNKVDMILKATLIGFFFYSLI